MVINKIAGKVLLRQVLTCKENPSGDDVIGIVGEAIKKGDWIKAKLFVDDPKDRIWMKVKNNT